MAHLSHRYRKRGYFPQLSDVRYSDMSMKRIVNAWVPFEMVNFGPPPHIGGHYRLVTLEQARHVQRRFMGTM